MVVCIATIKRTFTSLIEEGLRSVLARADEPAPIEPLPTYGDWREAEDHDAYAAWLTTLAAGQAELAPRRLLPDRPALRHQPAQPLVTLDERLARAAEPDR
jgi:hypothetical protein